MASVKSFLATSLAFGLFGSTSAHMMLASPVPFNLGNGLTTSPLKDDGSNYPCQVGNDGKYSMTAMNKIPVNEPVLLAFSGSATHEGGTCELAISMDKEPRADSVFKVIQVFEGNCPIAPLSGNLTFNIPKDFPTTDRATLAWAWYNKIGNREMYMNCAPVQITGGSNDKSYFDSLPNMFVANVAVPGADGQCQTVETKDTEIPNPGQFIIKAASASPGPATGAGCAAAATAQLKGVKNYQSKTVSNFAAYTPPASNANQIIPTQSGGGSGSASGYGGGAAATTSSQNNGMYTQASATSASAAPTGSAQPPASYGPASSATSGDAPSSIVTMVTSASAQTESTYPTMTPPASAGISGPASGSPAAAPTGSSSGSSAGSSTGTCSDNRSIVCNGPTQFGICNQGSIVWQPVAPGTTCANGAIQRRDGALARRHIRGSTAARQIREGAWALRKESLGIAENGE